MIIAAAVILTIAGLLLTCFQPSKAARAGVRLYLLGGLALIWLGIFALIS